MQSPGGIYIVLLLFIHYSHSYLLCARNFIFFPGCYLTDLIHFSLTVSIDSYRLDMLLAKRILHSYTRCEVSIFNKYPRTSLCTCSILLFYFQLFFCLLRFSRPWIRSIRKGTQFLSIPDPRWSCPPWFPYSDF